MTTVHVLHPVGWEKAKAACLGPRAGLTRLLRAWYMKNCSSLICYRLFISPHESSKLRSATTVCLDYTTPTCMKEHFAVQAVPLRWIKASRRYAGGSSLAQSKHHCHKCVFWRGNLYCCTWGAPLSSTSSCCWQGKSARVCQRGWWQHQAEDGGLRSSHTSGAQRCVLQLWGTWCCTPRLG